MKNNSTRGLDVCEPEPNVQVVPVDLRRGVVEVAQEAQVERLRPAWNVKKNILIHGFVWLCFIAGSCARERLFKSAIHCTSNSLHD